MSEHRLETCILCGNEAPLFFTDARSGIGYFHCRNCDLRFMNPDSRLDAKAEFSRYCLHENDVTDPGYQKFVTPLYDLILSEVKPGSVGLDYGCGDGPVLAHLLSARGYEIVLYDPYFVPATEVLGTKYDFVTATEVVEHFYSPGEEFPKLRDLLKPGGFLGLMTLIYEAGTDFQAWPYRIDPTHVCFYSARTFEWICREFGFLSFRQTGPRVVWFQVNI